MALATASTLSHEQTSARQEPLTWEEFFKIFNITEGSSVDESPKFLLLGIEGKLALLCLAHAANPLTGTDQNRSFKDSKGVVAAALSCLHHESVTVLYVPGIGSPAKGWSKFSERTFGTGIDQKAREGLRRLDLNFVQALSMGPSDKPLELLQDHYKPGLKIGIIDHSRGGLVGEHIVEFLAAVGLPGPTFERSVPELYDQLRSGDLDDTTVRETVRKEHGCLDIMVQAHLSFDTVTTTSIPQSGLGKWIPRYPPVDKKTFAVRGNIVHRYQALALYEHRGAFPHTMMARCADSPDWQTLSQVWFAVDHTGIGKSPSDGTCSLNDPPLAWGISQMWNAGFPLNNAALAKRFPNMGRTIDLDQFPNIMKWVGADMKKHNVAWKLLGWKERVPNEMNSDSQRTNEMIHSTVSLRGYGAKKSDEAVAKHRFLESQRGKSASWESETGEIGSAKLTLIEQHLLGLRYSGAQV